MRRAVCAVAFILFAVPLFAIKTNLIDDVIRMSKAGVADDAMIEYVVTSKERIEVTADDILAMKNAGVPDEVIQAVVQRESAAAQPPDKEQPPTPTAATTPPDPEEPTAPTGVYQPGCWTFDPPASIWWPVYGAVVPPQVWDPYWYQPRLDTKSGAPTRTAGAPAAAPGALPRAVSTASRPEPRQPSVGREHTAPPVAHDRIESAPRERVAPSRSSGAPRSSRSQ